MSCRSHAQTVPTRPIRFQLSLVGLLRQGFAHLLAWQGRAFERHHLKTLDNERLRDVGLTRDDLARIRR